MFYRIFLYAFGICATLASNLSASDCWVLYPESCSKYHTETCEEDCTAVGSCGTNDFPNGNVNSIDEASEENPGKTNVGPQQLVICGSYRTCTCSEAQGVFTCTENPSFYTSYSWGDTITGLDCP